MKAAKKIQFPQLPAIEQRRTEREKSSFVPKEVRLEETSEREEIILKLDRECVDAEKESNSISFFFTLSTNSAQHLTLFLHLKQTQLNNDVYCMLFLHYSE